MYGVDILSGDAETDMLIKAMIAATIRTSPRSAEFLFDVLGAKKYREITDMFIEINKKTGLSPGIEFADMEEVAIGLYSPFDIYEYELDGTRVTYMEDLSYHLIQDFMHKKYIDGLTLSHFASTVLHVYADNDEERLFGDDDLYFANPVMLVLEEFMDFISERYEYHLERAVDDFPLENIKEVYVKALKDRIYGTVSIYPEYIIKEVCGIETDDCIVYMDEDDRELVDIEIAQVVENMLELIKVMNSRGFRCDISTLPHRDAACVAITHMHDLKRMRAFVIEDVYNSKPNIFNNMLIAGMHICADEE